MKEHVLKKKRRKRGRSQRPLLFRQRLNHFVLAQVLRRVARAMTPFYRAIARNRQYAVRWSEAVADTDLTKMEQLLHLVSPVAARHGIGSNGIGYFVSFASPAPIDNYANGVTIPPGSVQFFFETRAHRFLARSVLPFYEKLAQDGPFATRLARAIVRRDTAAVNRLLRPLVQTPALRSIAIEDDGVVLSFVFPFSRFQYQNVLFREVIEPDWGGEPE